MLGRFAKTWGTHARTQPGTDQNSRMSWTTEVIDFIFTQWWKLWEACNQDRHGGDMATQQQATATQVGRALTMLYDTYANNVPQHLRWMFDTSIEVRQQCNVCHKAMAEYVECNTF